MPIVTVRFRFGVWGLGIRDYVPLRGHAAVAHGFGTHAGG
jgi:hypothetical protein